MALIHPDADLVHTYERARSALHDAIAQVEVCVAALDQRADQGGDRGQVARTRFLADWLTLASSNLGIALDEVERHAEEILQALREDAVEPDPSAQR